MRSSWRRPYDRSRAGCYKRRVIEAVTSSFRRLLVRWVDFCRRSAAGVAIAAVIASLGAGVFVATNMRINTDTSDMLSPELPFRRNASALSEAFPQFSDNIVVVVDGDNADLADDAADALAERMRRRPEVFGEVFDPAGHPFFRRNGLLYLDTDDLEDLADRLAQAQPFLGTLWRDPSLGGLFAMLEKAIDEGLAGDGDMAIDVTAVLDAVSLVVTAQAEGRFANLSWRHLMSGEDDAAARRLLLIQPRLDFGSLRPAAAAMAAVRGLAAEMGLDQLHGVRVRLTGSAALSHEELKSVQEGMGLAALLSLSLVVTLLLSGLGSARLTGAILATLVMGLVWTSAFALGAVGQLNLISVAFAILFIGLSVDFGIHFGLRYKEDIDAGGAHAAALQEAASGIGGALTLCAVAAAIGFFSFLPTDYLGLAELGLIAGVGMFVALFANLTVLPALLTLLPPRPKAPRTERRRPRLQPFIRAHPRAVAWGALAVGLAAAALVPEVRFDFDPFNLKDPETESASTLSDLMEDSRTSPYAIVVLAPDLEAATALGARVAALPEVDSVETLADLVPDDQEEKLDIIADMAFFLTPALGEGRRADAPDPGHNRAALARLEEKLGGWRPRRGGRPRPRRSGCSPPCRRSPAPARSLTARWPPWRRGCFRACPAASRPCAAPCRRRRCVWRTCPRACGRARWRRTAAPGSRCTRRRTSTSAPPYAASSRPCAAKRRRPPARRWSSWRPATRWSPPSGTPPSSLSSPSRPCWRRCCAASATWCWCLRRWCWRPC